jgi:predicted phosphate transport protein (TIGR00153 family)
MNINKILQVLVPKDHKFIPMLSAATANLQLMSKKLIETLSEGDWDKRRALINEIEQLEKKGDELTHKFFHSLSASFITPFDREDIHLLASEIDNVADYIHGTAKRLYIYKIQNIHDSMLKMADLIQAAVEELNKAILSIKDMNDPQQVRESCTRIHAIETHADDIYDMAISQLFEKETNAIEVIKVREVWLVLEKAVDKCEDAADVLMSILVKNS